MGSQATSSVIVLDRIEPDVTPEYCTHGRTPCVRCNEWCWLGHTTFDVVYTEQALPLCVQCATEVIPADAKHAGRVMDHLRKDGPHG